MSAKCLAFFGIDEIRNNVLEKILSCLWLDVMLLTDGQSISDKHYI